jgi:hypothetical protein
MTLDEALKLAGANDGSVVMRSTLDNKLFIVKLRDGSVIDDCGYEFRKILEECGRKLSTARDELSEKEKELHSLRLLRDEFTIRLQETHESARNEYERRLQAECSKFERAREFYKLEISKWGELDLRRLEGLIQKRRIDIKAGVPVSDEKELAEIAKSAIADGILPF